MSQELAVQDLGREKIELIKQTVAKGATDLELELFLHACKRTGLDPLMKQIYAIKRWSSADRREVLSFQTGIDGYRLIADRTGQYAGSDEPIYEEMDGVPLTAKVTVRKVILGTGNVGIFTATARWEEYVQKTKDGHPTSMWQKMPFLMLGKCAEALALRKAFPAELSGVYTHEEMMQEDTEPKASVMDHKRDASAKIAELKGDATTQPGAAGKEETRAQDGLDETASSKGKADITAGSLQDQDAAPSSSLLDSSNAINGAITAQEVNTYLAEFMRGGASKQDQETINKVAQERLKQLRRK